MEVHRPGLSMTVKSGGEDLVAPGILRNPVPVDALYDRAVAHELTLRNLLQRHGHESLEALRAVAIAEGREAGRSEGLIEGRAEGRAQGALDLARALLLRTLEVRHIGIGPEDTAAIESCSDLAMLDLWQARALVAPNRDEVFGSV